MPAITLDSICSGYSAKNYSAFQLFATSNGKADACSLTNDIQGLQIITRNTSRQVSMCPFAVSMGACMHCTYSTADFISCAGAISHHDIISASTCKYWYNQIRQVCGQLSAVAYLGGGGAGRIQIFAREGANIK